RWSDAEKLRIVEESLSTPRNASATARRYGISPQLLFAWRKSWRKGRLGEAPLEGFVPVVVAPQASGPREMGSTGGRMEVVSAGGGSWSVRISIRGLWRCCSRCWSSRDLGFERRAGLAGDGPYGY